MKFNRGQWIFDTKNKKPIWLTAISENEDVLFGWGIHSHTPRWHSCSVSKDNPRTLQDHEVEDFITAESEVEGFTAFKVVMQNPDDYLFKNVTKYGIEDPELIKATLSMITHQNALA